MVRGEATRSRARVRRGDGRARGGTRRTCLVRFRVRIRSRVRVRVELEFPWADKQVVSGVSAFSCLLSQVGCFRGRVKAMAILNFAEKLE